MRPKRQIRAPRQEFFLNLGGGSSGEVQVQKKNEYEVNKFLIDGDDAILSPMVTLDPNQIHERDGFYHPLLPPAAHAAFLKDPTNTTNPPNHPVVNAVSTSSTNKAFTGPAAQTNIPNSTASNMSVGPAKFIHVNNTNLFVLIDGISMFFEGKSTFTGVEDPLLRQHILEKKSVKALSNPKSNPFFASEASLDMFEETGSHPNTHAHPDNQNNNPNKSAATAGIRKRTSAPQSFSAEDTVENVIRYIQQEVPDLQSASSVPAFSPTSAFFTDRWTSLSQPTHSPSRPPAQPLPRRIHSLFANAAKPSGVPLFGRARADAYGPAAVASGAVSCSGTGAGATAVVPSASSTGSSSFSFPSPPRNSLSQRENGTTFFSPADKFEAPASTMRRQRGSAAVNHTDAVTSPDAASTAPITTSTTTPVTTTTTIERGHVLNAPKPKPRPLSAADVGYSNRSLDLDDVEVLHFIDGGSQGKVFCVRLDGKLYALKCIDVKGAIQATNLVERQGRKRGLVKELNMIRLQQAKPPPTHLMRMFNAVASLNDGQQLSILMELMSFGVDKIQQMLARIPHAELMKITQSTFKSYMAKTARPETTLGRELKEQHGAPSQMLGRRDFNTPKNWEMAIERQTPAQEILLSMIAADTLSGLRELHKTYNIVHCDIKPENILLSFDKQSFKITDFGCGCAMDEKTGKVRSSGIDLGAKLYRAPERLACHEPAIGLTEAMMGLDGYGRDMDVPFGCHVMEFDAKADVWSLGVMLLELACGVHPCSPFKSDFWNYTNELKLAKMVKPLVWSSDFCDFIVRCVCRDVGKRWSVVQLLQHPFILHYRNVPRSKLRLFIERLERESASFQRKQQRELLQKQILLSTNQVAQDNYLKESRSKWKGFTGFLSVTPELKDLKKFPHLA